MLAADSTEITWKGTSRRRNRRIPARPVKRSFARAGHTVAIVKRSRAVDAHAEIDMIVGEKCAPSLVDQRRIRLKRMRYRQMRRLQLIDHLESVPVERDGQDQRLAGVPHDRQALAYPA